MAAGHPFRSRLGHCARNPAGENKEFSPIFFLFLDCVFQLHQQQPALLEFNSAFLKCVAEHSLTLLFGTFIGNSEAERKSMGVREKTQSLWSYINADLDEHRNPFYSPDALGEVYAIPRLVRMRPWEDFHMRWLLPSLNSKKSGPDENASYRTSVLDHW